MKIQAKIKSRTKSFIVCAAFFLITSFCYSEVLLEDLLQGYLSNDLELQKLVLQQEYTNLSNKANKINNIISIQLATGTLSFRAGSNPQITFHPGMNISLPIANNLSLSASSDITLMQNSSNVENTEISASLDILSPSNATRKVNALKSERQVLESERNILNAALLAEKKFYNELKSLYSSASSIAQSQNDLYDASISLNTLKARGYSSSSQNYRSAELKVLSEEHTVKTSQRAFERDLALFFARCGFSQNEKYTNKEDSNAPSTSELNKVDTDTQAKKSLGLPTRIPEVVALDILSFSKENFSQIENAKWQNYINTLSRKADSSLTLKANAGYTFENSNTASDTVNIGTSILWSGISASAGIEIPTANKTNISSPAYTFSLAVNPLAFFLSNITKKQNIILDKQELLDIISAEENYNTTLISQSTQLENIQWEKERNKELFNMYSTLESDNAKYFSDGIITESEFRLSQVNKELYHYRMLINNIDLIFYNCEIKSLFYDDNFSDDNSTTKAR